MARAAGTGGGRASGKRTPWNYYGIVVLLVVLGVAGAAYSRHQRNDKIAGAGTVAPTVGGAAWHEALSVDICGKVQPNIQTKKDPVGLTTSGDGIIQIHPFVKSAAGANATLGKFANSIGMKLNAAELQLPGGHLYHDGDDCNGTVSHIYVKQYGFAGSTVGTLATIDPSQVRLADGAMLTVAFVPATQKTLIPPPPAAVQTALKADQASAASSTSTATTVAPSVTTPTPTTTGATKATPTTVAKAATPTTAAPTTAAPTTAAPTTAAPTTAAPTTAAP